MLKHVGESAKEKWDTIVIHSKDPVVQQGFTQVPKFILKDPNLSLGAKVTYSALLGYAWDNASVFPGQATLAKEMGVTERHVRRFISELKTAELLRVERRGLGQTNRYHLYVRVVRKKAQPRA